MIIRNTIYYCSAHNYNKKITGSVDWVKRLETIKSYYISFICNPSKTGFTNKLLSIRRGKSQSLI